MGSKFLGLFRTTVTKRGGLALQFQSSFVPGMSHEPTLLTTYISNIMIVNFMFFT